MNAMQHLVLFDIDGTLLWHDGAGRAALKAALQQVYGTAGSVDTFPLEGRPDRNTVRLLMIEAGIAEEVIWQRFEALKEAMVGNLRQRLSQKLHDVQPCPGGHTLIKTLGARSDVLLGLVTGNFQPTAFLKLEAAGYDPAAFLVGAYGDEAEWRSDLLSLAVNRASSLGDNQFAGEQVVIIGDTPMDIECGLRVGARTIAVCSGWNTRADLVACHPHFVVDDLSDTETILNAILNL